ncbi:MAG: SGNH/GDSL hydrolase family protein [Sedimentisphaerales bacterium]|nr:SGNH/GDSL hydrolase family protein [Sedimentisphaerales bacterium]
MAYDNSNVTILGGSGTSTQGYNLYYDAYTYTFPEEPCHISGLLSSLKINFYLFSTPITIVSAKFKVFRGTLNDCEVTDYDFTSVLQAAIDAYGTTGILIVDLTSWLSGAGVTVEAGDWFGTYVSSGNAAKPCKHKTANYETSYYRSGDITGATDLTSGWSSGTYILLFDYEIEANDFIIQDDNAGWGDGDVLSLMAYESEPYYIILEGVQCPIAELLTMSFLYTSAGDDATASIGGKTGDLHINYVADANEAKIGIGDYTTSHSIPNQYGHKITILIWIEPDADEMQIHYINYQNPQGPQGYGDIKMSCLMDRNPQAITDTVIRRLKFTNTGGNASVDRVVVCRNPAVVGYDSFTASALTTGNITASTIAFVDSDPDTITDSANGFVTAGFVPGDKIRITGGPNDGANWTVDTVDAGALTLVATDSVIAASAGTSITIQSKTNIKSGIASALEQTGVWTKDRYVVGVGIAGNELKDDATGYTTSYLGRLDDATNSQDIIALRNVLFVLMCGFCNDIESIGSSAEIYERVAELASPVATFINKVLSDGDTLGGRNDIIVCGPLGYAPDVDTDFYRLFFSRANAALRSICYATNIPFVDSYGYGFDGNFTGFYSKTNSHPSSDGSLAIAQLVAEVYESNIVPILTLPDEAAVLSGVDYGWNASHQGTVVLPVEANVKLDVGYGADGTEYTGLYSEAPIAISELNTNSIDAILAAWGKDTTYKKHDGSVRVVTGVVTFEPQPQGAGPKTKGPRITWLGRNSSETGISGGEIMVGVCAISITEPDGVVRDRKIRKILTSDDEGTEVELR